MICVICGKPVQKILHGYSVCPLHASSLDSCIRLDVRSPIDWFRMHRAAHLESQGILA